MLDTGRAFTITFVLAAGGVCAIDLIDRNRPEWLRQLGLPIGDSGDYDTTAATVTPIPPHYTSKDVRFITPSTSSVPTNREESKARPAFQKPPPATGLREGELRMLQDMEARLERERQQRQYQARAQEQERHTRKARCLELLKLYERAPISKRGDYILERNRLNCGASGW